jgi:hypothetical protein
MRDINVDALNKIATKLGTEPITIVEIDWVEDDAPKLYADRTVGNIPGKIFSIGNLDNVINVSESDSSQELQLSLDDSDGTIKAIIDSNDIHKRSARVYQWFEGLDIDDRFLVFAGKISSPITWTERDQSITFSVISQLEDKEVGFSAEEGDFDWIPNHLIGRSWPMVFGTVLDVPAMQFNQAVSGTTLCPISSVIGEEYHNAMPLGGIDPSWGTNIGLQNKQRSMLWCAHEAFKRAAFKWPDKKEEYTQKASEILDQINDIASTVANSQAQKASQEACGATQREATLENAREGGCNPVRILGGEDFPQNEIISIQVRGAILTGYFSGDNFHYSSIVDADKEAKAEAKYNSAIDHQCETPAPSQKFDFSMQVPCGLGNQFFNSPNCMCRHYGYLISTGPHKSRPNTNQVAEHLWIDSGARVTIYSDEYIYYVASIIPGTVLAVKAYKTFEGGEERLVNVPDDFWFVETQNYGPVTAVQVVLKKPLSSYEDQGWRDQIYVTFQSDVGPHTCDILQYIIDNYTDLEYDTTSFTAIRSKLDPFPMNFPILDRKNTLEVLQEIAFQARCALWLSNGKFYIKYLPEEPTSDDTITVSDLDSDTGIELEMTSTEDLVTKMIVEWWLSWAEDANKIILRHNIAKYGTQQETFSFYCFNQPDIVLKAATFWLIRKSNTWKKIRFRTFLPFLNLEVFDTATLDFTGQDYVATGPVKTVIEEASYNSADQTIDFLCLTPVRSGEMVEYQFFWPATLSPSITWPTDAEKEAGFAGGDGIGSGATGQLPIGFTNLEDWGDGVVWVGGPNIVFSGHADYGDRHPTDVDFEAQQVFYPETYAELTVTPNPDPDLTVNYVDPIDPPPLLEYTGQSLEIDIRTTTIVDSENDGVSSTLDTIYKKINEDGDLVINADEAKYGDEEHPEGEVFDYRFDDDGGQFGAGTAFLHNS